MQTRATTPPLYPHDWNFDSVPDHHLIACCYWEYARESSFLLDFKHRCVEANRHFTDHARAFAELGADLHRIFTIGTPANSFALGFGFEPGTHPDPDQPHVSGNFPAPWLSLSPEERDLRARIAAGNPAPDAKPFHPASDADAHAALQFLASVATPTPPVRQPLFVTPGQARAIEQHLAKLAAPSAPSAPPATLHSALCTSHSPAAAAPRLLRLDSTGRLAEELTLIQINWGLFDDDQILDSFRSWLKENRPPNIRPVASRGHRLKDWRAHLTRLAVLRLLCHFSALDLIDPNSDKLPALWQTQQFSGPTWLNATKWHDARREARQTFHQLFPFLPASDDPLSWPTVRSQGS